MLRSMSTVCDEDLIEYNRFIKIDTQYSHDITQRTTKVHVKSENKWNAKRNNLSTHFLLNFRIVRFFLLAINMASQTLLLVVLLQFLTYTLPVTDTVYIYYYYSRIVMFCAQERTENVSIWINLNLFRFNIIDIVKYFIPEAFNAGCWTTMERNGDKCVLLCYWLTLHLYIWVVVVVC